ncbi:Alpha/Beta hydrolase protein [Pseudoneurospora amorphoporcata]|uniref:Alpha/Beta hydrolase protein n=1 Tax=Pseudoneurospora amorphoporcata TaxID=241081 RepID=A0AAN6NXV6_9PEZI|nr:Alpha/Beta hydrolase protein [Pseudoneurospora amorphoporcata]
MADPSSGVQVAPGEEVKPYKIHIPTKHLDLTKQKLELTRLPHEGSGSGNKSQDWWEPKPIVEPLIDFWCLLNRLERYSWREAESTLNSTLPQFRTTITHPNLDNAALRVHFIHARSPHPDAVPLLLIPPFPFTNLSLGHLIKPLTDPDAASEDQMQQAFHLIIPSLPGLGLSDALPVNIAPIPASATILDTLMRRLGYAQYLATGSGPGHLSPAAIDFRVVNRLATHHLDSCVGAHLITPPLKAPTRKEQGTGAWVKWKVAKMLRKEKWGYKAGDWGGLAKDNNGNGNGGKRKEGKKKKMGLNAIGGDGGLAEDPNTLAYALCDSPTGMLVFVFRGLRAMGLDEAALSSPLFTHEKIITLTNMLWLPGPETAMRYWAHCAAYPEDDGGNGSVRRASGKKPKVAITVFTGTGTGNNGKSPVAPETTETAAEGASTDALPALNKQVPLSRSEAAARSAEKHTYVCPAWGNSVYDVVHQERASGHADGLLAFMRPEIIVSGVRGLAKEVLAREPRLKVNSQSQTQQQASKDQLQPQPQQTAAGGASSLTSFPSPSSAEHGPAVPGSPVPLDKIVVVPASPIDEPSTSPSSGGLKKPPSVVVALTPGTATIPEEAEDSDEEKHRGRSTKPEKGKAIAAISKVMPPPSNHNPNLLNLPTRNQSEGESPDTLVNTPSPSPSS